MKELVLILKFQPPVKEATGWKRSLELLEGVTQMKALVSALPKIRQAILNGDFISGERLQAASIAAERQTSPTVIREAFTQLAAEGLLHHIPNRGFFVPKLDLRELEDLTELRCQVETTAARLAVRRGDVRWESELIAIHHELSRTPRSTSLGAGEPFDDAWDAAHTSFHEHLIAGCGSDHFRRVAKNLADHTDIYRRWSAQSRQQTDRDPAAEHRGLLEAALERDEDLLAARLRAHYELTADLIRKDFSTLHPEASKEPEAQ